MKIRLHKEDIYMHNGMRCVPTYILIEQGFIVEIDGVEE